MRLEREGYTKNTDIRIAKSLIDYIFRWLGITFLPGYKEASLGVLPRDDSDDASSAPGSAGGSSDDEPKGGQSTSIKPRPPVADKPGTKTEGRKKPDGGA